MDALPADNDGCLLRSEDNNAEGEVLDFLARRELPASTIDIWHGVHGKCGISYGRLKRLLRQLLGNEMILRWHGQGGTGPQIYDLPDQLRADWLADLPNYP